MDVITYNLSKNYTDRKQLSPEKIEQLKERLDNLEGDNSDIAEIEIQGLFQELLEGR